MNFNFLICFLLLISVKLCLSKDCGIQKINPSNMESSRIVNGEEAIPHSWPWVVSIGTIDIYGKYDHGCGGTLIDYDLVATAAHCLIKASTNPFKFILQIGVHELVSYPNESISFGVLEYSYNSNFELSLPNNGHDIGLIKLNKTVTLSEYVAFICIPSADDSDLVQNKDLVTIGW